MRWILFATTVLALATTSHAAPTVPEGWQEVKPGGATKCARGGEYSFLYHAGDPKKVIVTFGGGGACWDSFSCGGSLLYKDSVAANYDEVSEKQGVWDLNNPKNPYFGWTQVVVPYCTGDVHLGNGEAEYERWDGSTFSIHHGGADNAKSVMSWMQSTYKDVQNLVVAGCSAGAYGSVVWTPTLAEIYKSAKVSQYADSGAGVMDHLFFPQWKVEASLPNWVPGMDPSSIDWDKLTISDVYKDIAGFYPNAQFSTFNHSHDSIQKFFYGALGGLPSQWTPKMFKIMEDSSAVPNFKYYVSDGSNHCAMINSRLYDINQDGVSLADWLRRRSEGEVVDSVGCKDCSRVQESEGDSYDYPPSPEEIRKHL